MSGSFICGWGRLYASPAGEKNLCDDIILVFMSYAAMWNIMCIWRFPETGVAPNHPLYVRFLWKPPYHDHLHWSPRLRSFAHRNHSSGTVMETPTGFRRHQACELLAFALAAPDQVGGSAPEPWERWLLYNWQNSTKMDDLGVTPFRYFSFF